MFDQIAELEENRQLDKLLHVLVNQTDEEDESEEESDTEFQMESQDEEENSLGILSETPILPRKPLKIEKITTEQLSSQISLSNLYQNISFEEFDLITDCKDADLKELMILNRAKHVHLKTLISKYEEMLIDCASSLRSHLLNLRKRDNTGIRQFSCVNRFGFPYFTYMKSRPLNNSDFFRKKALNIVNLAYEIRVNRWVQLDLIKLKTCVLFNYYSNYLTREGATEFDLGEMPVSTMNASLWREKFNHMHKRVKEMGKLVNAVDLPAPGDSTYLDWDFIAENHFKDAGRASSLKAMWNNYVHPKINLSDFTDEEIKKIVIYIHQHPDTNWSSLSKYLNTNRSEHQLCTKYQLSLYLDPQDVDKSVSECIIGLTIGEKSIQQVMSSWKNFPAAGVTKEFKRILKREQYLNGIKDCRKGNFSLVEDTKILALVKKYGLDFKTIGTHMPTRSCSQIQNRYYNTLCQEDKRFANWSLAEDETILAHVDAHGEQKWSLLTEKLPRNSAQLRHRYARLKKRMDTDPEFDLTAMPRRHGFDGYARRHKQINLRAQMTDEELERVIAEPTRRVRMRTDADDQLVAFFSPAAQLKKANTSNLITQEHLKECTTTVKGLLSIFSSTLRIPKRLDSRSELDQTDVEILTTLKNESSPDDTDFITVKPEQSEYSVIPPNESTMQTLRFLLLQSFGTRSSVSNYTPPKGDQVKRFKERFKTLLYMPSLLSTIEPDETICPIKSVKSSEPNVIPMKRKSVGRPLKRKNLNKQIVDKKSRNSRVGKCKKDSIEKVKLLAEKQCDNKQTSSDCNIVDEYTIVDKRCLPDVSSGKLVPCLPKENIKSATIAKDTKVLIQLDKATIAKLKKLNVLKAVKLIEMKKPCVIITRPFAEITTSEQGTKLNPDCSSFIDINSIKTKAASLTNKQENNKKVDEVNAPITVAPEIEEQNIVINLTNGDIDNEEPDKGIINHKTVETIEIIEPTTVNSPGKEKEEAKTSCVTTRKTRSKTVAEKSVSESPKIVRSYANKRKLCDIGVATDAKKSKNDLL